MLPVPGQPIPHGCAVVLKDCTLGESERELRRRLARHVGHIVRVPEIVRYHPPRSNQQNRTVRGLWMPIILDEKGYYPHDKDYVYDQIKLAIGWTEDRVDKHTGEVHKVPRPTATLDTAEYSKFMEIFRAYVEDVDSGFGILLPDPDPTLARI
jgi:hypothetical protein